MQAYLILANGRVFRGVSVGCPGTTIGEVVFATGMVGFEETLTDPSYYGQIITQTYPLIGNYGMNSQDVESGKIWAKGYIVREACKTPSNFRSEKTLDTFLKENGIIGIEGIDTRSLTRTLRESGVMNGAITTEFDPDAEPEKKAALLPQIAAYAVVDAVKTVTCREAKTYEPTEAGEWGDTPLHVALLDLGCKNNIVRCLQKRGCRVTVLPGTTTAAQLAELHPDGLMLSNGPGDPAENVEIIANIRKMLSHRHPYLRHLPGPPAHRPGCRCPHLQAEVRPPRREPACYPCRQSPHLHHQPEPRLRRGQRDPARRCGTGQLCECQRRHLRGRATTSSGTASPSSSTPKPTAAPRIPNSCLTNLSAVCWQRKE